MWAMCTEGEDDAMVLDGCEDCTPTFDDGTMTRA